MDELLCKFLAKNKYPEIKYDGLSEIDLDPVIVDRMEQIDRIEGAKNKDEYDILALGWHYLGWNGGDRDLHKAEHWGSSSKGIEGTLILILCYLMNDKMSYSVFQSKYSAVIANLIRFNGSGGGNGSMSTEMIYRLFRLISGWVRDHDEYALSQDLMTLSEWIGVDKLDPVVVDMLINRWVAEGRKSDLHLIRMVVGGTNQKLDSLLGINSGIGGGGNGGGNGVVKRNLGLVMRMGK